MSTQTSIEVTPCTWKYGKLWAYTVTYDEALEELFDYTVPLHKELGIPGHVEVLVGSMGKIRQLGDSSYDGWHQMGAKSLVRLIDMGWGVGSHSWSHGVVEKDLELELNKAKQVLENAIGHRIVTYAAPNNNSNMTLTITRKLKETGYLCALSCTDDVNLPNCDLWSLNRTCNIHRGWGPLYSAFDPYNRLSQARAQSAWIIDYCHCPSPNIPHESKDVYIDEHRRRLETVLETGGEEVWIATVEEIVDYILCRRNVKIETGTGKTGQEVFNISLLDVPEPVSCRHVTFDIRVPSALCRCPMLDINDQKIPGHLTKAGNLRVTLDLSKPIILSVGGFN